MKVYYGLIDFLTSSGFARRFGKMYGLRPARIEAYSPNAAVTSLLQIPADASRTAPLWFHAASVGELEMIAPLLDRALELGIACSVSAFSDSALPWLRRLEQHPHARLLRFVGLSPRERDWAGIWERLQVREVWIAKYDLWPGMWVAAAELGIRINVANAQIRPSWQRLRQVLHAFFKKSPALRFYCSNPARVAPLQALFPEAEVQPALDPRRVRIRARAETATAEAQAVRARLTNLPRPLGIIGSAWPEDLAQIAQLTSMTLRGSIAVFPHSFEPADLAEARARLTDIARAHPVQTLFVEQKGVLVECYADADWVWIGGGFGRGIHSTLEPAYYRKPLIAGPRNAHQFDEIDELKAAGLLTICETSEQIQQWFQAQAAQKAQASAPAAEASLSRSVPFPTRAEFEAWADPLLAPYRNPG